MTLSRILIVVASFCAVNVYGQVAIGHYTDLDGLPTEGYLDPISYSPEKQLIINYKHQGFEKGFYYDKNGDKNSGLIKIVDHDKIYFKAKQEDKDKKIKAEDLQIVKVGVDSFFTIPSVTVGSGLLEKTTTQLVHYVTTLGSTIYARYYNLTKGGFTYYYKKTYGASWNEVPSKNKDFQEFASKDFYHIPYLEDKISNNEFSARNMMTIIKVAQYDKYMSENKSVPLSKFWEEIKEPTDAYYEMKIVSRKDSIYSVQFVKDDVIIYEGEYSSFFPHRKNGIFKAYSEGRVRKEAQFLNNELRRVKTYYSNDTLHHDYSTRLSGSNGYEERIFSFNKVQTQDGENLLERKYFIEENYDKLNDRTLNYAFRNNYRDIYYTNDNNEKVYQLNSQDYNTRIDRLQSRIDDYLDNMTFEEALIDNANGTVMVAILIDADRNVNYDILNTLHPEVDKAIEGFFKSPYFRSLKFPKFKIGKESTSVEFVVPVTFMINRFYRNPPNYHYNHFNHHMMMQMNTMPPINPPSFPRY